MEEKEVEKKESKRKRIIIFIIVLILIHIFLNLIKVPIQVTENYTEEVPYQAIENYTSLEPVNAEQCYTTEFNYRYDWDGWNPEQEGYISPRFRLYNLENRTGEFTVYFAFFDQDEHRYEDYQGKDYAFVREQLPWDKAAMYSSKASYGLSHNENVLITIFTKKKDPDASYWAYADITAPTKVDCESEEIYEYITRNRSVTKYRTEDKTRKTTKYLTLWQLLMSLIFR